jgi:hypothetical protein
MWVALRKAAPESNEQLALKVSKMQIELEDVFDALERWGKRTAVRESRDRSKKLDQVEADLSAAPTPTTSTGRTGILRSGIVVGNQQARG